MPQLGEVRKGYMLGYKNPTSKYIWAACPDCNQERWIRMIRHKPSNPLCQPCASRQHSMTGARNPSWKGGGVKVECQRCGNEFVVQPSRFKYGMGKFCSKVCQNLSRRKKVECICAWCGKKFLRPPSNIWPGPNAFCSKACAVIYRMNHGGFDMRPTSLEKIVIQLCQDYQLPYKYVGDGQIWIVGRNPDFINTNHKKQVIEVFGSYWHPLFDGTFRTQHYKQFGFDCLVIWEEEFKALGKMIKKLRQFASKAQN